jgi:hypothetical protein
MHQSELVHDRSRYRLRWLAEAAPRVRQARTVVAPFLERIPVHHDIADGGMMGARDDRKEGCWRESLRHREDAALREQSIALCTLKRCISQ